MITRFDIQAVIGPHFHPSEVAGILAKIRANNPSAVEDVAQMTGAHVVTNPRVRYVALVETTLAQTSQGSWHVAPTAAVTRVDAVGAIAMTELLRRPNTVVSGQVLRAAAGLSGTGATMLLIDLVACGVIEPHHKTTGGECMSVDEWLYGIDNEAANALSWTYTKAS